MHSICLGLEIGCKQRTDSLQGFKNLYDHCNTTCRNSPHVMFYYVSSLNVSKNDLLLHLSKVTQNKSLVWMKQRSQQREKSLEGQDNIRRRLLRCAHYFHSLGTTFHVNVKFLLNYSKLTTRAYISRCLISDPHVVRTTVSAPINPPKRAILSSGSIFRKSWSETWQSTIEAENLFIPSTEANFASSS